MKKIIIASGYFNPLHIGHLSYLKEAKELGDYLFVIVNNDIQVTQKGATPFMNQKERLKIISALRDVDLVFLSIDIDKTVKETIATIISLIKDNKTGVITDDCQRKIVSPTTYKFMFAKGGDSAWDNTPEKDLLPTIFGVGGEKVQSSSWLKDKIKNE